MSELKIGKMSNKDIAEWMGIPANTFNKSKEKYLKELANFVEFHLEGKKIVIDKILNDKYEKKQGSTTFQKIKEEIDDTWDEYGLDSCSRVSDVIYEELCEDESFNLKPATVYNYTIKGRNELYGKPFSENGGQIGNCIYVWCKKKEDGKYAFLNDEEKKIKEELQTKYFGNTTEKQIMVKAMVSAGEISKEEAWDILEEITNMRDDGFMGFLKELQAKIGCQVVRGTYVTRNIGVKNGGYNWEI